MSDICLVTGCAGLIGSEVVRKFHDNGYHVVGIDNGGRRSYFGDSGSSVATIEDFFDLKEFEYFSNDITDVTAIESIFQSYSNRVGIVIHAASLPAHTTCNENPYLAYSVNVTGTFNVLEATRKYCPAATFIFCSSSKVYVNRHSSETYMEYDKRYDFSQGHPLYEGIPETWNPDCDDRSMLGSTKLAADVLCQQYALTYGINMMISRPGTLTGPSHAGVKEHGFLSYLTRCGVEKKNYTIFGYKGKQVRSVWHASDMVEAFRQFIKKPKNLGIYNIDGSRHSNVSTLEAIDIIQEHTGNRMKIKYVNKTREADHRFFIGNSKKFLEDYPKYEWTYNVEEIIKELCDSWKRKLNK